MDEEAIFNAAIEKPSLAERARFLGEACAGDAGLRSRVEALLAAFDQPESFLNGPVAGVGITLGPPLTERPGQTIGRYKLLEEIGEGGGWALSTWPNSGSRSAARSP